MDSNHKFEEGGQTHQCLWWLIDHFSSPHTDKRCEGHRSAMIHPSLVALVLLPLHSSALISNGKTTLLTLTEWTIICALGVNV